MASRSSWKRAPHGVTHVDPRTASRGHDHRGGSARDTYIQGRFGEDAAGIRHRFSGMVVAFTLRAPVRTAALVRQLRQVVDNPIDVEALTPGVPIMLKPAPGFENVEPLLKQIGTCVLVRRPSSQAA